MDQRSNGSNGLDVWWIIGLVDPSGALWIRGLLDQRSYRSVVRWIRGPMDQRSYGSEVLWIRSPIRNDIGPVCLSRGPVDHRSCGSEVL